MRSPNGNTIGRGMKVNKEEMLGMLAALELFVQKDHAAETREFETPRRNESEGGGAPSAACKAEIFVPEVANHVPHVRVSWDRAANSLDPRRRASTPAGRRTLDSASARKRKSW